MNENGTDVFLRRARHLALGCAYRLRSALGDAWNCFANRDFRVLLRLGNVAYNNSAFALH